MLPTSTLFSIKDLVPEGQMELLRYFLDPDYEREEFSEDDTRDTSEDTPT
jgi:hypothetical protein